MELIKTVNFCPLVKWFSDQKLNVFPIIWAAAEHKTLIYTILANSVSNFMQKLPKQIQTFEFQNRRAILYPIWSHSSSL